jgi:adenylate cyclase
MWSWAACGHALQTAESGHAERPEHPLSSLRLEIIEGEAKGNLTLSGISVLGRDPTCAVVIVNDRAVSREHAMIRPEQGVGFVIEDLDSRGGTFVNGVRTRMAVLLDGDTVRIGGVLARVRTTDDVEGEVPLDEVEVVKTKYLPTQRLSLDAVRFRTSRRFLKDTGRLQPPSDMDLVDVGDSVSVAPPAPVTTPGGFEAEGFAEADTLIAGSLASITGDDDPYLDPVTGAAAPESDEAASEVAHRLELLLEITASLAAIHEPTRLTRETALRLLELFPQAQRIGFFQLEDDPTSDEDILRPTYLVDRSKTRRGAVQISHSVLQATVANRQAILSEDIQVDPRFSKSESLEVAGVTSILCTPLCLGERILGAVYVDSTDPNSSFDEGALRLLTGISAVLAAAYENARLFASVQAESVRRASLERYFSPDLVDRVMRGDLPLAREGREANGTILFVDIRGFSSITLSTPPKILVATLNAYFAAMQRIIFRSRGTVERFGGDSILAYWGIVDEDPLSATRALRASLAMQVEVFRLNPELRSKKLVEIEIGIGLNTGPVISGDVGSAERYEFTILGDAVNMARRFEALAPRGQVIAGEATVTKHDPRTVLHVALPPTTVKGKVEAINVSAVYGLRVDTGATAAIRYDLAIPGELDFGSGAADTIASGLDLAPDGRVALEVLTPNDPAPGTPVIVTLRIPRQEGTIVVKGRVLQSALADTLLLGPSLSVTAGAVQRIRINVADPKALLWPMGLA